MHASKEIKGDPDAEDERKVLSEWLRLTKSEAELKKQIKAFDAALDAQALAQYPLLTTVEIQSLVVQDKMDGQPAQRHCRRNRSHQPDPDPAHQRTGRPLRHARARTDPAAWQSWKPRSTPIWPR